MGINLPPDCRIETTIENHDWLSAHTNGLRADNDTIVCNVGSGNTAVTRNIYRVISFAHTHDDIGKYQKTLLHGENEKSELKAFVVFSRVSTARPGVSSRWLPIPKR